MLKCIRGLLRATAAASSGLTVTEFTLAEAAEAQGHHASDRALFARWLPSLALFPLNNAAANAGFCRTLDAAAFRFIFAAFVAAIN